MIQIPKNCEVNKFLPKKIFYEKIGISSNLKEEFINKIDKIVWKYKISEGTIGISKTKNIEEIQIFEIELKEKEIPKNVLKTIINAIPYKILFVLKYKEDICYSIAVNDLYFTVWNEKIDFDFTGINLEVVYQKIVKKIIKQEDNSNDFNKIIANKNKLEELNKKIGQLERKLHNEKQFNRKVEINQELLELKKEREELLNG